MSRINKALQEIKKIDELASRNTWMNTIHPLIKMIITLYYIIIVVSFSKYDIYGLAGMVIYPLVIFQIGDISLKDALYRLRIILPVVCFIGIFNPFFDHTQVIRLGKVMITGGMLSMFSLMLKGILTVLASYILIATTTIEKVCFALSMLHLPKAFITQILLIYRYITLMLEEAHRMSQAYSLRAPGQKGIHHQAWGSFVGRLILRSMDMADDVYHSMMLRGFHGDFQYGEKRSFQRKDLLYGLFWLSLITVFRVVPVFVMLGTLFG